jgi:hypothetical protein
MSQDEPSSKPKRAPLYDSSESGSYSGSEDDFEEASNVLQAAVFNVLQAVMFHGFLTFVLCSQLH